MATCLTANAADDLFTKEVAPLLQRRCLSCHHDGEAKGDLSLSSRTGLIESGYVDTDDVDASYLLEVVTPENGNSEMPKDAEPLSADEIAVLRRCKVAGKDHIGAPRGDGSRLVVAAADCLAQRGDGSSE